MNTLTKSQTMDKDHFIQGTCMQMCPPDEIKMREKEKLLHILEMVPGTERIKLPKASSSHMVKAFSRSAAGKQMTAESLRPPQILLKTVQYLLCDVIQSKRVGWTAKYDFITDRLMAVRQDLVVQNVSKGDSITILQPIVRFHAYSAYKLCEQDTASFDPVLNNKHLQECLKKLLYIYDTYDYFINLGLDRACTDYLLENRPEFEALYLIFNLGNNEALRRSLTIPAECNTSLVQNARQISLCFKYGNFVRLCRWVSNLPPLLAAVASLHMPEIRRKTFQIMSYAYHSKNLSFPLETLQGVLLYDCIEDLRSDLNYYGLRIENGVLFNKQDFNCKSAVRPKHVRFVDEKCLDKKLNCILLGL